MKQKFLLKTMLLLCLMMVGVGNAWADDQVTLWSEDFSSYSANDVPSGGTYSYTCGGANTKIYEEALAGGSSPELLLQKSSNGTFTATIPLENIEGDLTLTFKTNNQKIKVETTTTGLTGSLEEKALGTHTATFKGVTTSTTSITIKFTCSGSSNVRLDDILLLGTKVSSGGGDTPTTYAVTYDGNGATSGTVPTDATEYDADNNTVTVLGNTGNLALEHYTFTGWNTKADGTGTGYDADDTFTISANTTLYAQWAANTNTVTLPETDQYGTYTMSATNPVAYGTEVTLTYTPATGYENYKATWSVNGEEIQGSLFTMPDGAVTVTVSVEEKTSSDLIIDFESNADTYSDWTFSNIVSNYSNSGVSAHGGSKYGSTDSKASGSIQTKEKVNPVSLTCYVSKQTTNTTLSTWYVQVSSDGTTWNNATSRSATDMGKGDWKELTADLSSYSDVYVRVYYSGSTAVRLIDDLTLTVNGGSVKPSISASDVNIDDDTTSGSIVYSINNPVDGGVLTATTENDWLTIGTVGTTEVPFTCSANEDAIERTATVTLTYTYNEEMITKDVTVTQAAYVDPNAPGTENNPYTVAQARAAIDANAGVTGVYALGKVSAIVTDYNSQYENITFDISSDGTTSSDQLRAYRCVATASTDASDVKVGDEVVIYGDLTFYTKESIYEFTQGCQLVSLTHPVVTTPSITVNTNSIEATADGAYGTITVTYNNITDVVADVYFCDVDGNDATYDWIEAEINGENNVEYIISANTGEARTAYFKVYATDDETNLVYSNLVTVTQAKYVETTSYTLATTITSGKHYIIANGDEDNPKAMGGQNNNNRAAVEVAIEDGVASVSSDDVYEFVIQGPDANGNYTIYDNINSGYLFAASNSSNHLKNEAALDNNNNGKWSIDIDGNGVAKIKAQGTNSHNWMRYNSGNDIFSCYVDGQQDIYLYEKDGEATPTETIHISDVKYATYCSENALDFENTGLTAYIAKMDETDGTTVEFTSVTKVPAYTGVLLKAENSGDVIVNATSSVDDVTGNVFIGVTEQKTINETGIFVLMNGNKGVGFYQTTTAFTVGAHTAYLPSLGEGSRSFIGFDDVTAVKGIVADAEATGEVYNLQGQRVVKAQKGLYIMNGKKVLVK